MRVREYPLIDAPAARDRQQAGDPVTSRVTCRPMHAPLMVVKPPDRSDRPTGRKFDRSASPRQRYRVTERALGRLALGSLASLSPSRLLPRKKKGSHHKEKL